MANSPAYAQKAREAQDLFTRIKARTIENLEAEERALRKSESDSGQTHH